MPNDCRVFIIVLELLLLLLRFIIETMGVRIELHAEEKWGGVFARSGKVYDVAGLVLLLLKNNLYKINIQFYMVKIIIAQHKVYEFFNFC